VKRSAVAHGEGTTILIVGATPGEAFRPGPGEIVAPMFDAYREGDYEEAARIVREIGEETGEPIAWFNLACCEARLGRTDDALEHLEQAIALDDRFAEQAKGDEDLESLRDDARFKKLVA
jgi:tetratricopeptide (TPR) repeat protein